MTHGDARRRRPPRRIDQEQQLDDVVGRRVRRLHDEEVRAANVLIDPHKNLAVGETGCVTLHSSTPSQLAISSARGRLAVPDNNLNPCCGMAIDSIVRCPRCAGLAVAGCRHGSSAPPIYSGSSGFVDPPSESSCASLSLAGGGAAPDGWRLPLVDSNHHSKIQSLVSCHWTKGQCTPLRVPGAAPGVLTGALARLSYSIWRTATTWPAVAVIIIVPLAGVRIAPRGAASASITP